LAFSDTPETITRGPDSRNRMMHRKVMRSVLLIRYYSISERFRLLPAVLFNNQHS